MSKALFQAVSPALSTLFGSVDGYVKAGAPVFRGSPGSIVKRKNQNNAEFYVHRFYDGTGSQQEAYLGLVGASEERVETLRTQIEEVKRMAPELRLLVREGFQSADPKTFATLASLHLHGLFAAGATLIGSHAFGVLINQMGIRAAAYATEDIDVARREVLAFDNLPQKNFLEMLRDSGIHFVEVPQLNHKQPSSSFKQQGMSRFHVDLLVPSPDAEIRIVEVPELKAHATALPYLSYVLGQTQISTLLSREGCCPVRVPVAERFAIHKLVVSQLRTNRDAKTEKDIFQAAIVLAALGERFPGAIETAVMDLPISARKYLTKALPGVLEYLLGHPRAIVELEGAVARTLPEEDRAFAETDLLGGRQESSPEMLHDQVKAKLAELSDREIHWSDTPFKQVIATVLVANERWAAVHTGKSAQILDRENWPLEEGCKYLLDNSGAAPRTTRQPVDINTVAALQHCYGKRVGALVQEWAMRDKDLGIGASNHAERSR